MHAFFTNIAKIVVAPLIAVLTFAGYSVTQPKVSAAPQFTAAAPTTLYGSGISSSDTSIRLTALTTPNGYPILTADLVGSASNVFYVTVEPSSVRKETISCNAVSQNSDGTATVSGCSRGLLFTYPYTASTTLARTHAGGSSVVISNSPQLYQDIITYVNSVSQSGVNDASLIAKGIVEVSTAAEAASHAQNGSGDTSAYLALTSNIASSTRTANTKQVVVASTTGYIDDGYISTSTLFYNISPTGITSLSTTTATSTMIGFNPAFWIGKNMQMFTANGTFTVPKGINKLTVWMVSGGGGGGGGANNAITAGGGGGGGAFGIGQIDVTGTTSIAVTIGAAGTGGTATANGNTGGTSFLSTFMNCTGGNGGGVGSSGAGTAGGGGSGACTGTGVASLGGSTGQSAFAISGTLFAGIGGAGPLGSFGQGGTGANSQNGTGNSGAAGLVIIFW